VQIVEAGGTASGATVSTGGSETVSSSGVASNTTISGGFVEVVSGGSIGGATGTITFAGGGVLQLDASTSFSGQIGGFGGTDELDLRDIQYISGTTSATFTEAGSNTSGTLTVTDGTHTAQLTLLGTYATSNFAVGSDGHGGTLVTDPPGGGMMTFADLDPQQMTTTAAGQFDASGYPPQDATAVIGSAHAGASAYPITVPSSLGTPGGYHIPLPPGS
jgi:autotransporter passenger strand-loop-strand repeat protein